MDEKRDPARRLNAEAKAKVQAAADAFNGGRVVEAATIWAELARTAPADHRWPGNLAVALRRLGKLDAAIAAFRRALALAPDEPTTLTGLGNALRARGDVEEAMRVLSRAFVRDPKAAAVRYNLALSLRDGRRLADAGSLLAGLVAEFSDRADYRWDLALTRLQLGEYEEGFRDFEARWKLPRNKVRLREGPQWDGGDIDGQRILLQAEKGIADAILFARYVPLLAQRGAKVAVECAPVLARLFASLKGVEQVVQSGTPAPEVDRIAPLLSLPRLFGTQLATVPAEVPYLTAAAPFELPATPGARLKLGLVWAATPAPRDRSWPLPALASFAEIPHVAVFSLQTGPRAHELAGGGFDHLVHNLAPRLRSLDDVAAAMQQLDLLITVDTAVAHLAGALGRPTVLLLRHVADWRWSVGERTDCPWYPTMRVVRQMKADDFATPVEDLRKALTNMVARDRAR